MRCTKEKNIKHMRELHQICPVVPSATLFSICTNGSKVEGFSTTEVTLMLTHLILTILD